MAKGGKSANPADAFRKAQRAKELKKNKAERVKARETATLKKDTSALESEIRRLRSTDRLDKNQKARLEELEEELGRIKKVKAEYVEQHPEHRHLVYPEEERRRKEAETRRAAEAAGGGGPLYDEKGRLRDPTRSIYYDPVLNPYGVPPPGMPYKERPPAPDELEAAADGLPDEDDDEDSDDDIPLPDSPPPGAEASNNAADDSDDDSIELPEGTPPPEAFLNPPEPVPPAGFMPPPANFGAFPPGMGPPPFAQGFQPGFHAGRPQMHPGFNGFPSGQGQPGQQMPFGAPPPGFFPGLRRGDHHPNAVAGPGPGSMSGRGRGGPPFRGAHRQSNAIADPLSDAPHESYQAHRQARRDQAQTHSLPQKPGTNESSQISANDTPATSTGGPGPASAVISAEPQLRDLRKEAAAFVPRGLKKKQKEAQAAPKIDAAPVGPQEEPTHPDPVVDEEGDRPVQPPKPAYNPMAMGGGLLGKLSSVLGNAPATAKQESAPKPGDDYKAFLAGLDKLDD